MSKLKKILENYDLFGKTAASKSVVFCCSQRFKKQMYEFIDKLKSIGNVVVYEPYFVGRQWRIAGAEEKQRLQSSHYRMQVPGLVRAHLERIRQADIVFIFNPTGYVGVNTTLELGFANALNKPIYAMSTEMPFDKGGELCREIFYIEIIKTPLELFKKLL